LGACRAGTIVKNELENRGYYISAFVDSYSPSVKFSGLKVIRPEEIMIEGGLFLFIAIDKKEEILTWLNENVKSKKQYIYPAAELPRIHISSINCNYKDSFGNEIMCEESLNVSIVLTGYNNKIHIGKDFSAENGAEIIVENNSRINLGDEGYLDEEVRIVCKNNATLDIGDRFFIKKNSYICSEHSSVMIGRHFTACEGCRISASKPLEIGDECMFSVNVFLNSSSVHSIFDLKSGGNLLSKETGITIDNHVWVGANSIILPNAIIGHDSVIGAGSIVKIEFPSNVIIAGVPATIKREGIVWDRQFMADFSDCSFLEFGEGND